MTFRLLPLLFTVLFAISVAAQTAPLSVELAATRYSYSLGEVVELRVGYTNHTKKPIHIGGDDKNVALVQIASPGEPFRAYTANAPDPLFDGVNFGLPIPARSSRVETRSVLWNWVAEPVSGWTEPADPVLRNRITTNLAFPQAGRYSVRILAYLNWDTEKKGHFF